MGDMKTPDFDDLLAAFDIPDIDANEAIHSGPEENEGPGGSGKPEPSVGGESGEATANVTSFSARLCGIFEKLWTLNLYRLIQTLLCHFIILGP